jgi:hypothetical protein
VVLVWTSAWSVLNPELTSKRAMTGVGTGRTGPDQRKRWQRQPTRQNQQSRVRAALDDSRSAAQLNPGGAQPEHHKA